MKKIVQQLFLSTNLEQIVRLYNQKCPEIAEHYQLQEAVQIVLRKGSVTLPNEHQDSEMSLASQPSNTQSTNDTKTPQSGYVSSKRFSLELPHSSLIATPSKPTRKSVQERPGIEMQPVTVQFEELDQQIKEFLLSDSDQLQLLSELCGNKTFYQQLLRAYRHESNLFDQLKLFLEPFSSKTGEADRQMLKNHLFVQRVLNPLKQVTFFPHIKGFITQLIRNVYDFDDEEYFSAFIHLRLGKNCTQRVLLDQIRQENKQTIEQIVAKLGLLIKALFPCEKFSGIPNTVNKLVELLSKTLSCEVKIEPACCQLINKAYGIPEQVLLIEHYIPEPSTLPLISMTGQLLNLFGIKLQTNSFEIFLAQIQQLLTVVFLPVPYIYLLDFVKVKLQSQIYREFMQFVEETFDSERERQERLLFLIGQLVFNEQFDSFEQLKKDFVSFQSYCFDVETRLKDSNMHKSLRELRNCSLRQTRLDESYTYLFRLLIDVNTHWPAVDFLLQFVVGAEQSEFDE